MRSRSSPEDHRGDFVVDQEDYEDGGNDDDNGDDSDDHDDLNPKP